LNEDLVDSRTIVLMYQIIFVEINRAPI